MALRERKMMKHITGSGGGTLVAEAGESFRVTDVFCLASGNDTYLNLLVDGKTVNKIRVAGKSGSHLPYPVVKTAQLYEGEIRGGLFAALRSLGFDLTIPVPAGSTFAVSRYAEAGDVCIVYDRYDPGDVKPDEPNGPLAKILRYLHYAENAEAITASPVTFGTSLIWTGMDKWPIDGTAVPTGFTIRMHGILAAPCAHGSGAANKGYTTHLLVYREGDMLFDSRDQVGIPLKGNSAATADSADYTPLASVIGPFTATQPKPGLMLAPPLDFVQGDKVTIRAVVAGAAADGIAASELDLCLLLEKTAAR